MVALEERTDGTDDISVFDKIRINKLASQVNGTDVILDEDLDFAEGRNMVTGNLNSILIIPPLYLPFIRLAV